MTAITKNKQSIGAVINNDNTINNSNDNKQNSNDNKMITVVKTNYNQYDNKKQ